MRRAMGLFAGVIVLVLSSTVHADAGTVADWRMNEGRNARVMHDTTGNHDARIGHRVKPGRGTFRFIGERNETIFDPQRIVVVEESDDLDPLKARYEVEIRFRTRGGIDPNLVQKGQHGQVGGFFKVTLFQGRHPRCGLTDASGRSRSTGLPRLDVTDGRWTTFRCTRTATATTLVVLHDGKRYVAVNRGPLGRIDNDQPMAIGGKYNCAQTKVECDYFRGHIDYVTIRKGS
jgi:hypothetical protein